MAALTGVLAGLPADFPAAVLVLLHLPPHNPDVLAGILGPRVRLPVEQVRGGERLAPGKVFLASADHHLLVEADGTLALADSLPVQHVRPSADVLFSSLASAMGPRGIAVVLTGSGRDGAAGVVEIKRHGGFVIVQDEATSKSFGMPGAALATGSADRVLPLAEIAPALTLLVGGRVDAGGMA